MSLPTDMARGTVIALDAMGGDHAPLAVIEGAAKVAAEDAGLSFLIFGDEAKIAPLLAKHPALSRVATLHHTDHAIAADEKPSAAIRQGKQTSMRLAIQAVADKQASAIVSSGNTGALMALSTKLLKTLPGIDRPAITSLYPTLTARCVMLDVGANVATDAEQLFQFAVMGRAYARVVFGKESPTIGLLNIGSEEMKGHDVLREAAARFRASFFAQDFKGFVEGTDLSKGTVDVVVTDGFTGNVSIKTTEGFAAMLGKDVKAMLKTSWLAKIGFAIALIPLKKLARKYDPARYNGAMLVGLNGVVIKSHGSATTEGFANAVRVAAQVVRDGMNERVMEAMAQQAPQAASVQTEVMSGA